METYHQIDIGLDTFPYNGHTTSLDSFWMGVPVVTLVGQTVVGRAGLSQLTNLGLDGADREDARGVWADCGRACRRHEAAQSTAGRSASGCGNRR